MCVFATVDDNAFGLYGAYEKNRMKKNIEQINHAKSSKRFDFGVFQKNNS